ncbi:MAG TPA: hypothetical protein VMM38_16020 [Aridibacter sp.]|nr:hypothetical protein [Aridibacter sp.]
MDRIFLTNDPNTIECVTIVSNRFQKMGRIHMNPVRAGCAKTRKTGHGKFVELVTPGPGTAYGGFSVSLAGGGDT